MLVYVVFINLEITELLNYENNLNSNYFIYNNRVHRYVLKIIKD